ncbi:MAG: hypothetical protein EU530_09645 [Promethearchaeota archaeon]|nr:MAG: hypothetical protein EU530_09645 [Candidatus Lokiarchaeota archaeon]
MEEFGEKMAEFGKKIEEKVKKSVDKAMKNLERDFPHVQPPRPPRPPRAPDVWSSDSESFRTDESERAKVRAPIDKIKLLKELLDEGIISQEDYDEKKKKILEEI